MTFESTESALPEDSTLAGESVQTQNNPVTDQEIAQIALNIAAKLPETAQEEAAARILKKCNNALKEIALALRVACL